MLDVSAADQSRLHATRWSQRPKLVQGSLEPVTLLGALTAFTFKRGEVYLGMFNEVWLHRFSSPPFGSLFILSPSHTRLFSSFLSCLPAFMFCHLISFLFLCTHGPSLSMSARNLLQPRFQVAQVFTMRWVFIGCPCALGSLSSQPHTALSRLSPFHVFTLVVLSTHLHIRGGVCVPLGVTGILADWFCLSSGTTPWMQLGCIPWPI